MRVVKSYSAPAVALAAFGMMAAIVMGAVGLR